MEPVVPTVRLSKLTDGEREIYLRILPESDESQETCERGLSAKQTMAT